MTTTAKAKAKGAVKSKTAWFGLALAVTGIVQANIDVFSAYLTPTHQGFLTMGVGIAVVVLRFLTDEPLEEK